MRAKVWLLTDWPPPWGHQTITHWKVECGQGTATGVKRHREKAKHCGCVLGYFVAIMRYLINESSSGRESAATSNALTVTVEDVPGSHPFSLKHPSVRSD